jgi:guanylate kinase
VRASIPAGASDGRHRRGRLLVVIGPSASGKSSIVRELSACGLVHLHATWTTRPRRPDEGAECIEHRFVSAAEFALAEASGRFLETATISNLPYRYGLPHVELRTSGPLDTVMVRSAQVPLLRSHFPDAVVYALVARDQVTATRLRRRGGSDAELEVRVRDNTIERAAARRVAHRTFESSGDTPADLLRVRNDVRHALACDFALEVATCPL